MSLSGVYFRPPLFLLTSGLWYAFFSVQSVDVEPLLYICIIIVNI